MPNATPTHVVEELLTLAVIEPTIGCRQYADRLAERGYRRVEDDGAEAARRPRPGPASPAGRPSRAITAATSGLSTEPPATTPSRSGSATAARPGDLVAIDSFYIGNLKGVGKVYQLTAIDIATRWAMMLDRPRARPPPAHTIRFIEHVIGRSAVSA